MANQTIVNTDPTSFYPLEAPPYRDASRSRLADLSLSNTVYPLNSFNDGRLAICPPTFTVPVKVTHGSWSVGVVTKVPGASSKIFEFTSSGGTGLSYDSGMLKFTLKHEDSSVTAIEYPYTFAKVSDVWCVRDTDAIMMYVDALLVGSAPIASVSPVVVANTLTIGDASQRVFVANPVAWDRSVSSTHIKYMSDAYRNYPSRKSLFQSGMMTLYTPELLSVNNVVSFPRVVKNESVIELEPGVFASGLDEAGVSVSSTIHFAHFVQTASRGVRVSWAESLSAIVEYTVNGGSTWLPVTKGRIVTGTGQPATPILLGIRVSFQAGSSIRPFISSLSVIDYTTNILNPLTAAKRQAQLIGDVYIPHTAHHPQLHGDGMRLYGNGILEILPDVDEQAVNTAAVEFVVGFEQSDITGTKYILNSSPEHASNIAVNAGKLTFAGFSKVYINGVATSSNALTIVPGLNYHIAANYTSANNAKITFGMENSSIVGPISTISTRSEAFTDSTAQERFESYIDYPRFTAPIVAGATVNDANAMFYSKDWTVRGT